MKLTVFQSDKGDCLLLTSTNNQHCMLIDGGMRSSYRSFVAPALGQLKANGKKIDVVCVSHIDQDHISGVLQLMDDLVAWRVHLHQRANGNPSHPEPLSSHPPDIGEIWHNAFHELVGKNAGAIEDMLAATATILSGSNDQELLEIASHQRDIATSIPEAINLSRRISSEQLDIPLNRPYAGKLAFVSNDPTPQPPVTVGNLKVFMIGPFEADLKNLRAKWNKWLNENQSKLIDIQRQARRDAERLGTSDIQQLLALQIKQSSQLGDRNKVTTPNLASLMFLVEENGKTILFTGDGHWKDILKGLKFQSKLDVNGRMHVNVLKVQHHGSEHNINEEFVSKITADHYVFCGNGEHENPDLRVIKLIIDSRLENVPFRANHSLANNPFNLWFNSSESATKKLDAKEHMKKVKNFVDQQVSKYAGSLTATYVSGNASSFDINL